MFLYNTYLDSSVSSSHRRNYRTHHNRESKSQSLAPQPVSLNRHAVIYQYNNRSLPIAVASHKTIPRDK